MSGAFVARRLLESIPSVLLIIVLGFVLIHLAPGDPSAYLAGEFASAEYVQRIKELYGLDRPIAEQLLVYLRNMLTGNVGESIYYRRPASEVVIERIPVTLLLVLPGILISIALAIPIAIVAARKHPSKTTGAILFASYVLYSIPVFVFGLLLMIVFGIYLGWLPTSGMIGLYHAVGIERGLDVLRHLILPVLTLVVCWGVPQYVRLIHASILEVSREDFIMTAKAIGLDEATIFRRHAFRNALLPIISLAGYWTSMAIGGVVFTESVFAWPGIGRLLFDSIQMRDYTVTMFVFILISIVVVITHLITDIMYTRVDPRIMLR
jgi:peptide/nickel transport system permease protein